MSDILVSFMASATSALFLLLAALVPTIVIETAVAGLFGIGRRGIAAVALVNLVTNPLLNAALAALYGYGIGAWDTHVFSARWGRSFYTTHVTWLFWAAFALLEIGVVFVEWGLLLWALRDEDHRPATLLLMSAGMNAASALAGLVLSGAFVRL